MDNSVAGELTAIRESVELLVRLKLHEVRGNRTQKDMIHLLDECGCGPTQIARLLNTTPNSVNPVLSRSRQPAKARANGSR